MRDRPQWFINVQRRLQVTGLAFSLALVSTAVSDATPPDNPTRQIAAQRWFAEALHPDGAPAGAESEALLRALSKFTGRTDRDDFSSLTSFLDQFPNGAWQASLRTELGAEYFQAGWYGKALLSWERVWQGRAKVGVSPALFAVHRAGSELAAIYAQLGRAPELRSLLPQLEQMNPTGQNAERIRAARDSLWSIDHSPEISLRCGALALDRVRSYRNPTKAFHPLVWDSKSTTNGMSLSQVAALSSELGMNYQMAFRARGSEVIVPAVMHWSVGHFDALLREGNGLYQAQDPRGGDTWVSSRAIDQEGSGYFLVRGGPLPAGWRAVTPEEGGRIFGKGPTGSSNPDATSPYDDKANPEDNSCGMASWNAHLLLTSQEIKDTPIGYNPPYGPPVFTTLRYIQRQNTRFGYNYRWLHNWQGVLSDDTKNSLANVLINYEGGWLTWIPDFDDTNLFRCKMRSPGVLKRTSSSSYVWQLPDGMKRLYSTMLTNVGRRSLFLSGLEDVAGNRVTIAADQQWGRVNSVTDPLGQVTRFYYELPDPGEPDPVVYTYTTWNWGYSNLVTRIVDPFGRTATLQYKKTIRSVQGFCPGGFCPFFFFDYDPTNIVDVVGLSSQFTYNSNAGSDYVETLTTPYGTTRFEWSAPRARNTILGITHPNGDKERIEYSESAQVKIPFAEVFATVPQNMLTWNRYLYGRNTFHWDRKAYADGYATNDFTKARIYHFAHDYVVNAAGGVLESFKAPMENRVWFNYPGQAISTVPGTSDRPSKIGRVLDDGTTQLQQFEYNALGNMTRRIDPVGRTTSFIYATNDMDLLEVRQERAGSSDLLTKATYDSRHLPSTLRDAAGQTTHFAYNNRGQILGVTNARNDAVSFEYDANGYLLAIDGPLPGAQDRNSFTYDAVGRVRTATDPDGYAVVFDYDALDRLLKVTYPDGTWEGITYDRLKPGVVRDRLGRETRYAYDPFQQISAVEDPLGRVTRFDWCKCGDTKSIIDPMGRTTSLRHDLQGRLIAKEFADGSKISFDYERTTSRLWRIRDEQNQQTQFSYYVDNRLAEKRYVNALVPTPPVRFTHDPDYARVLTMEDGNGTTAFTYHPMLSAGAGRVASIDGPWANDTTTLAYDTLGRLVSPAINGVAARRTFDSAGRLTQLTNVLGVFDLTWVGGSARLGSVHYPNGQATEYSYHPNARDQLLQRTTHRFPNNSVLSEFTYLHNAIGQVTNLTQLQAGSLKTWAPTYDPVDRLTALTTAQGALPDQTRNYAYDADDNLVTEQANGASRNFSHNILNQITAISDSPVAISGYQWDAEHRLVALSNGTHRTEFIYDGAGRRTGIVERENGVVVSERRYVWMGSQLWEERDATGANTLKRFSSFGVASTGATDLPPGNYFFTRDNLGSVREMCDQTGVVRGQFEFSPYGTRQRLAGDLEPGFGFTGHPLHLSSSLHLAPFRAYDARMARWISRDPAGESEGVNLYAYVLGDPINFLDPLGHGGTAADPLVQNTAGYKDAKAGINAYETAKGIHKTIDSVTDKGGKAVLQDKVQGMGQDAVDKITATPINQYKDTVNEMAATADSSGRTLDLSKSKAFKSAIGALGGTTPCAPTTTPPKVDSPNFFESAWDWVFGPSKPDVIPRRDGPIKPSSTFSVKERAAAAAAAASSH